MIAAAISLFTGPLATVFLLVSFTCLFARRHFVLDKLHGTYRTTTYIAGLRVKEAVYTLDNVEAVYMKPYTRATSRRPSTHYLLEIGRREGDPIPIALEDDTNAEPRAQMIADFLRVSVRQVGLSPSEAKRLCLFEMRLVWAICGIPLTAVCLFFSAGFTIPVVGDALVLSRYNASDLVQVPCRILSFDVHRPKTPDGVRNTDSGGEATITTGTLVDVRFEYEYEGKRYESTKYGPFSRSASDNVTVYSSGQETLCYLNPRWPDEAVLNTEARWGAFIFAALFTLIAMPAFYITIFMIARSCRPHYLSAAMQA